MSTVPLAEVAQAGRKEGAFPAPTLMLRQPPHEPLTCCQYLAQLRALVAETFTSAESIAALGLIEATPAISPVPHCGCGTM